MAIYPYIPARHQWPRARGTHPTLFVIHSMEYPEKGDSAEDCAAFFRKGAKVASTHLCVDSNTVVNCVPFDRKSAGAAGGPYRGAQINNWAIHIEHAGYARQSYADWTDAYSTQMLNWSSLVAAEVCAQYGIPPLRLSPHELRIGKSGICTHKDISDAFYVKNGHWDPGPGFPMNSYIAKVNYWLQFIDTGEDDMYTQGDREEFEDLKSTMAALLKKVDAIYVDTHGSDHPELLAGQVKGIAEHLGVPTE